ncbi:hypothetical protein GGR56DRAFT_652291 [Xylariaceae sp. FL0804]|nr:hypothetical protein GGR56DRAFT_652291 [Xylariaceae sp. FL0804]
MSVSGMVLLVVVVGGCRLLFLWRCCWCRRRGPIFPGAMVVSLSPNVVTRERVCVCVCVKARGRQRRRSGESKAEQSPGPGPGPEAGGDLVLQHHTSSLPQSSLQRSTRESIVEGLPPSLSRRVSARVLFWVERGDDRSPTRRGGFRNSNVSGYALPPGICRPHSRSTGQERAGRPPARLFAARGARRGILMQWKSPTRLPSRFCLPVRNSTIKQAWYELLRYSLPVTMSIAHEHEVLDCLGLP